MWCMFPRKTLITRINRNTSYTHGPCLYCSESDLKHVAIERCGLQKQPWASAWSFSRRNKFTQEVHAVVFPRFLGDSCARSPPKDGSVSASAVLSHCSDDMSRISSEYSSDPLASGGSCPHLLRQTAYMLSGAEPIPPPPPPLGTPILSLLVRLGAARPGGGGGGGGIPLPLLWYPTPALCTKRQSAQQLPASDMNYNA